MAYDYDHESTPWLSTLPNGAYGDCRFGEGRRGRGQALSTAPRPGRMKRTGDRPLPP